MTELSQQQQLLHSEVRERHSHYHKSVQGLQYVDVYRVLTLFNVSDPCLQHAIKKLLVAGGRGAGKDIGRDVQEAVDSLKRWQEMRSEDLQVGSSHAGKPGLALPRCTLPDLCAAQRHCAKPTECDGLW